LDIFFDLYVFSVFSVFSEWVVLLVGNYLIQRELDGF